MTAGASLAWALACLATATAAPLPRQLPVFFADNHAETCGWIARRFDPGEALTLVLVDAHSDATAAQRSEQIREQCHRAPSASDRAKLFASWRRTGRLQAFNWLEPLLPRPVDRVLWLPPPEQTADGLDRLHHDAVEALDGRLEVEPRAVGSLAPRWQTVDRDRLAAWQPGLRPVVLAIDLDFFADCPDASTRFRDLWRIALQWPALRGVAFAISRPWLASNQQADSLALLALDAVRHTRGSEVEWDFSVDDCPDDSLQATALRDQGRTIPRWDVARAGPALRASLAGLAGKWTFTDHARADPVALLGVWPPTRLGLDGREPDLDGVWRLPAGTPAVLRLHTAAPHSGRVRWFARVPASPTCDLLPETRLGKGFSQHPARWVHFEQTPLATTPDPALPAAAWQHLLESRTPGPTGCGRVLLEAEYETAAGWLPAGPVELRLTTGEGFRAGLSECFGMPYAFGIATQAEDGASGVDTGWGSDCSNFLIHAWRRSGTSLAWGDPGQLRAQLATLARDLTLTSRAPLKEEWLAAGLALDFGSHVAALWQDREPRGVLDGGDLVAHHLGGTPEILTLKTLARDRPPFALRGPRTAPSCRLLVGGDLVPAGERSPEVAVLTELAKRADLVLANLEGVPADSPPDPANAFDLRFPVERLPILRRAGLTVVGWANNHVADAGLAAIAGGRRALEAADLGVTGAGRDLAEALRPWRAQTTGVRLAVFAACLAGAPAATASAPGVVCLPDHAANLGRAMLEARARREVVLLLLHGGDEYRSAVNEEQGRWARWAVDHGASVVAGSGPHVWQRREFHRGAVVAHSLGNSLCPPRWQGAGSGGWWLLTLDAAGRILHQQTIPAKGPPEANNQAAPTAPGR